MVQPPGSPPAHMLENGYGSAEQCKAKADVSSTRRSLVLACLVLTHFLDGVDKVLLPASYRALERDLGFNPGQLSILSLCQGTMMCLSAPLWGCLADHGVPRKYLMAGGTLCWGFFTAAQGTCDSFLPMVGLRLLNGMALGTVSPVAQSLIIDLARDGERGWLFGLCFGAIKLGEVISAFCATSLSMSILLGYSGWRVAFVVVGAASLVLAAFIVLVMYERPRPLRIMEMSLWGEFTGFLGTCRIPTFRLVVLQGCFGSIPMAVLDFLAMWFMYVGFTPTSTAFLTATFPLGAAAGNLLGGVIGDALSRWSKYHGRPLTAQISVGMGIPVVVALFLSIPRHPDHFYEYMGTLLTMGLVTSWCSGGVNAPILSQVVIDRQATVFAWLVAVQGGAAYAIGAPTTAFLAENVFGYEKRHMHLGEVQKEEVFHARQAKNAEALGSAMLWCTTVPWLICFVCYSFLHFTYKPDLLAARQLKGETENDDD